MYPTLYYLLAAGLLAALIYLCQLGYCNPQNAATYRMGFLFFGLALLLLGVMRTPSIVYNRELNVDESQLLAQAITLKQDPVYGRSVDGTSIGPINSYLLLLPAALGLPLEYTAARLIAVLLIAIALGLFYFSLVRLTTPLISRLSLLPILLFFACTTEPDFLHYSSELSSLVILTACFYLSISVLGQPSPPSIPLLAGVGGLAGLTVYSKLQALPIVSLMLLTVMIYLWRSQQRAALKSFLVIALSFLAPSILVFAQAYYYNTDDYFIDYYFIGNLTTYAQIYAPLKPLVGQGFGSKLIRFPAFLRQYTDFLIFIVFNCVLLTGATLLVGRLQGRWVASSLWVSILVGLTAIGALWTVITPGTEIGHHLLLVVFPFGWLMALAIHQLSQMIPDQRVWLRLLTGLIGLYILEVLVTNKWISAYRRQLVAQVATQGVVSTMPPPPDWLVIGNPYLYSFPNKMVLPLSPVSRAINQYTRPLDRIAVWGWNCQYYVETGLAQGVRENHTQRSIMPNRMRAAYLGRYAQDLVANQPAVFVDAVGRTSLFLTQPKYRHEQFTLINRIIRKNYRLVGIVSQVRIYVRRDRLYIPLHQAAGG